MKFYKFYKPHPKSQSACLWFCSMNALTSYKSHPKSQMSVFDFVAWVCVQICGNDTTTESRTWILHVTYLYKIKNPCMGNWCFRGTILYRIKGIPSHHLSPLQYQNLMDPKKNGLMEMILLQKQEPEFYNILHLISLYKVKDPYMLGKKGFRGTILYRIKFIPSYYLKTSEDLTLRGMLY